MVEIFKTSVAKKSQAKKVLNVLSKTVPEHFINFDLDDCDRILRVECDMIEHEKIVELVQRCGFTCENI